MLDIRIAEELELCNLCDRGNITDSTQFRINRRARLLAELLITDEGLFNKESAKAYLKEHPLPSYAILDDFFQRQAIEVINYFLHSEEANLRLRQLSFPLANGFVEDLIRNSLLYPRTKVMVKRDILVSLLMALFSSSRQHVGSCFATAPLLMIARERPERLFRDLYDVVTRGYLKRVIEGREYRVPLSIRTGPGETYRRVNKKSEEDPPLNRACRGIVTVAKEMSVRDYLISKYHERAQSIEEVYKAHTSHPLLKCFEYTLAAFSDFTIGFSKWNFITALGLKGDEEGGLGELIRTAVQAKLDDSNEKIRGYVEKINHLQATLESKQRQFRSASSLDRLHRMKREIQTGDYELHNLEILYEDEVIKSEKYAKLFAFFVEQYELLFPLYFQEVYDPEMMQHAEGILQDTVAGYRLLYKHGRIDPRVWNLIEDDKMYISSLVDFFQITELSLMANVSWEEGKDEIRGIVDEIILRVQEKGFLEGCYQRITEMHLEILKEQAAKTPYSYPSGGSSEHLLRTYLSLREEPLKVEIEIHTPWDFFHNLVEYMKDIPYEIGKKFEENPSRSILMVNPVHAFVFYPSLPIFYLAWQDRSNTFTYIRDTFIKPSLLWLEKNSLPNIDGDEKFTYMIHHGYPGNIPFADTNWSSDFFSFFFHPDIEDFVLVRTSGQRIISLHEWDYLFKSPHNVTLFPQINDFF